MKLNLLAICFASIVFCASCGSKTSNEIVIETEKGEKISISEEPVFDIITSEGTIRVKLYKQTPNHRNNFAKLAFDGFYEDLIFHRVVKNLMIQTGDPLSRNAKEDARIGDNDVGYDIDAEIFENITHKYGSLCAVAHKPNKQNVKQSSGSQFYILSNKNGAAHLDGKYTVFGETIDGLSVVDSINNTAQAKYNRPEKNIVIEKIVLVKDNSNQ